MLGLTQLLPVYTSVLANICANLTLLVLHRKEDDKIPGTISNPHRDHLVASTEGEIDAAVAAVVKGLPMLKKLQLGSYFYSPGDALEDEHWGRSRAWIGFVDDRAREAECAELVEKEKLEREKDNKKRKWMVFDDGL